MRGDPQKGNYMYISNLIIQPQLISKHDEKEHSSIFLKKENKIVERFQQQLLPCSGSFNKINIYGIDPPTIICYTTYPLTSSLPGNGWRRLMSNISQRSERNEKQKNAKRKGGRKQREAWSCRCPCLGSKPTPCTDSNGQSLLENNKTPLPSNWFKKCGFVIVLKDQTQTNNGTWEKNIGRRLRLVSIQRPRAKRPEEKGIQDKMRLTQ